MSKKDDCWDDFDDYLINPFHDERQYEDNIETEEKDDEYCINQDDESEDVNQNDNGENIGSFC
jgi:hypothetical protein